MLAAILALFPLAFFLLWGIARGAIGADAKGARLERVHGSAQWKDDHFESPLPRLDAPMDRMVSMWLSGSEAETTPSAPVPFERRVRIDYEDAPATGLRVTWLGHSTLLVEIDGMRVLIDPVWGDRASPFTFAGPKRFFPPPLPLAELPHIDAVLISHDHYDHLDMPTVKQLLLRADAANLTWVVPLGVGADLEAWGVTTAQIAELDWWQDATVGALTVTATPARHFSGRWIDDQTQTLWAGYAIAGPRHRAYYSGDTALFPELIDIGDKLGPFDLTMIEAGAYDAMWADVHLGPEQAVLAHRLVGGRVMVPVHWGMFDLALHGWTEPVERVVVEAAKHGVDVRTPRPGAVIEVGATGPFARWWPDAPWRTVAQAPVWSSHTESLRAASVKAR